MTQDVASMTVVERVEKAIRDEIYARYGTLLVDGDGGIARAAIAAMREPSGGMVDALGAAPHYCFNERAAWSAAIDAALNEGAEGELGGPPSA